MTIYHLKNFFLKPRQLKHKQLETQKSQAAVLAQFYQVMKKKFGVHSSLLPWRVKRSRGKGRLRTKGLMGPRGFQTSSFWAASLFSDLRNPPACSSVYRKTSSHHIHLGSGWCAKDAALKCSLGKVCIRGHFEGIFFLSIWCINKDQELWKRIHAEILKAFSE